MGNDSQDTLFKSELLLKALFDGQRDTNKKIDALHAYITDHMTKEEEDRLKMAVQLAKLDERVSSQSAKWGMVSTIVTSVLSAAGVSFFAGFRK